MDPDKVDDFLDIDTDDKTGKDVVVVEETKDIAKIIADADEITEEDFEYIRDNLKEIIDTGKVALEELVEVARQSQHPRAYEVLSTLMKTLTDTNRELLDSHKKKKDIVKEKPKNGPGTINNHLFVGTPAELQAIMRGKVLDGD